jgi:uncharacterized protein YkwD
MVPGSSFAICRFPVRAPIVLATLVAAAIVAFPAGAGARHRRRIHGARACANANTPVGATSRQATKDAVVCLINRQRAARGLPALRESRRLDRSSQGWTNTMVATGAFTHGADFAARISAVGFAWRAAGENIATGFLTPRAVVNAWMGSTGHCQNILNPSYSDVGTGVVHRNVGFKGNGATWTQDFALAAGRRAPSRNSGPMNSCPY